MTKIEVKHRYTQATLLEADAVDLKDAVEKAVSGMVYLGGADLHGADLRGADLYKADLHKADLYKADLHEADLHGADLHGADLHEANLHGANLHGANLHGADLHEANLHGANLHGADLHEANLHGANLCGANLHGADLRGAKMPWQSHAMVAELLRRGAGDDIEKLKVAGLIAIHRSLCWADFLAIDDPLKDWALDTLAAHVQEGDGAPGVLASRKAAMDAAKAHVPATPPRTVVAGTP